MPDKTAHHPDGHHTIKFGERWHTYEDNRGKRYTSGTKFVGQFFPKFDMVAVSKKCSNGKEPKYAGRTPEEIRNEWSENGRIASDEGTNLHEYAESLMAGWKPSRIPKPMSNRCKVVYKQIDIITAKLLNKFVFVCAEMIVFSPSLKISGMVDLVMFNPRTDTILILDWKTNKDNPTVENGFGKKAFPPVDHLDDTKLNHYRLQLSLYRYIMESEGYFPNITNYQQAIIHLSDKDYTVIPLEYYEYEIKEALKSYE